MQQEEGLLGHVALGVDVGGGDRGCLAVTAADNNAFFALVYKSSCVQPHIHKRRNARATHTNTS